MVNLFEDKKLINQLDTIRNKMKDDLKTGSNYLNESLDYLLLSKGKMLRPALLLIGSRFGKLYNKKEENLIDLGTAIETLHTATLLHDDVIDNSSIRRGIESVQSKYSKEYAVYMGDYLLSRCFLLLTELQIPKDLAIRLSKVVSNICLGEIRQYRNRYNLDISLMDYFRIVSGKTAALFSVALSAGSYITDANKEVVKKLGYIGYELGLGFQLVDDILDFIGDEDKVGKELKSDLIRGNYGMPLIFAIMEDSSNSLKLREIIKNDINIENIDSVIKLVKSSGGIKKTEELVNRYHNRAIKLVDKLPENSGKDLLLNIVPKLMDRVY